MITLEEQIRRYATEVAGPAVGAPPADLVAAARPRHRGRWALVAALVVFVAGLTWLATRPSELGGSPVVDTIGTPTTTTPPVDAMSGPGPVAPCNPACGDHGVTLTGPQGEGLCVAVDTAFPPDPVTGTMLTLWDSGRDLGGIGIPDCTDLPISRSAELSWRSAPNGQVLWTTVSRGTPPRCA